MTCLSSTTMTDHQKLLAMIEDRAEAQAALRMMLNLAERNNLTGTQEYRVCLDSSNRLEGVL